MKNKKSFINVLEEAANGVTQQVVVQCISSKGVFSIEWNNTNFYNRRINQHRIHWCKKKTRGMNYKVVNHVESQIIYFENETLLPFLRILNALYKILQSQTQSRLFTGIKVVWCVKCNVRLAFSLVYSSNNIKCKFVIYKLCEFEARGRLVVRGNLKTITTDKNKFFNFFFSQRDNKKKVDTIALESKGKNHRRMSFLFCSIHFRSFTSKLKLVNQWC